MTLPADGRVRATGISSFMVDHRTVLRDKADVVPAVNQIEVHPSSQQREVEPPAPSTASSPAAPVLGIAGGPARTGRSRRSSMPESRSGAAPA